METPNSTSMVGRLRQVGKRVVWLAWYNFQLLCIVYPFEAYWRVCALCEPTTWVFRRRVLERLNGGACHGGGRYAVLAMFPDGRISPYLLTAIESLNRLGVNIIAVSNAELTEEARDELLGLCRHLVVRRNVGRDFGAYKDGIRVVRELCDDVDRLILLNDSVIYLSDGLDALLRQFLGPEPYIGLTEVHDRHHHVQSFLMSFGAPVVNSRHFQGYWRRYIPVGTRRWSIHKGEVGLTEAMLGAGFQPKLVASLERLEAALVNDSDIKRAVELLPDRFFLEALDPNEVISHVLSVFTEKNQIHVGAFLLTRHAISPLFKRDIVSRGVYSAKRLETVSGVLGVDLQEMLQQQEIRPLPQHALWVERVLFRFGSV